jgi:hypothetical protein
MTSHPNAIAWWKTLSLLDLIYWNNRFDKDEKKGEEQTMDKAEYCYQKMLWERCENGSC